MSITGVKVVIDTNVFITIFKKDSKNRWMLDKILNGQWILCITNEIFLEYWEVLDKKNKSSSGSKYYQLSGFSSIHPIC